MFAPSLMRFAREMVKRVRTKTVASKSVSNSKLPEMPTKARPVKPGQKTVTSRTSTIRKRLNKQLPDTQATTLSTPWRPLAVRSSWKKIITHLSPSTPLAKAIESSSVLTSSGETSQLASAAAPSISTYNSNTETSSKESKNTQTKMSRHTLPSSHAKSNQLISLPGAIIPMIPGVKSIKEFNLQKQKEAELFRNLRRTVNKKKRIERSTRQELENRIREEQKKLWEAKSGRGVWRVVRTKNSSSSRHRSKNKNVKNKRKHINKNKSKIDDSKKEAKNTRSKEQKCKLSKSTDNVKKTSRSKHVDKITNDNSKLQHESISASNTKRRSKLTKAKTKPVATKEANNKNVRRRVSIKKKPETIVNVKKSNSKQRHSVVVKKGQGKATVVKSDSRANSTKRNSTATKRPNIIAERFKFFKKAAKK